MTNNNLRPYPNKSRLAFLVSCAAFFLLTTLFLSTNASSQETEPPQEPLATYTSFLPFVMEPPVSINSVNTAHAGNLGNDYIVTVSWSPMNQDSGTTYIISEADNPSMTPILNTYVSDSTSLNIQIPASTNNVRYFTVKADSPNAIESDPVRVVGAYRDDFTTNTGWDIRRQDFDDTENIMSYGDRKSVV